MIKTAPLELVGFAVKTMYTRPRHTRSSLIHFSHSLLIALQLTSGNLCSSALAAKAKGAHQEQSSQSAVSSSSRRLCVSLLALTLGCSLPLGGCFAYRWWFGDSSLVSPQPSASDHEVWQARKVEERLFPEKKLDVHFLAQLHHVDALLKHEDRQEVERLVTRIADSQMALLLLLRSVNRSGPAYFFAEGVTGDLTPQRRKELAQALPPKGTRVKLDRLDPQAALLEIRDTFPEGIPSDVTKMSWRQLGVLYALGAPSLLWAAGEIDTLYGTSTKELDDRIAASIKNRRDRDQHRLLDRDREIEALARIFRVAGKGDRPIYLIYGGGHPLKKYEDADLQITKISTYDP